jgi:hypothetical protein
VFLYGILAEDVAIKKTKNLVVLTASVYVFIMTQAVPV